MPAAHLCIAIIEQDLLQVQVHNCTLLFMYAAVQKSCPGSCLAPAVLLCKLSICTRSCTVRTAAAAAQVPSCPGSCLAPAELLCKLRASAHGTASFALLLLLHKCQAILQAAVLTSVCSMAMFM
jgi:hypothetical protein